jgi:hypothetical protein
MTANTDRQTNSSSHTLSELFHGYHQPSTEFFDRLWDQAFIAYDASFLLNLYTYSAQTRDELLRLLGDLRERSWLPYQAAVEYYQNRPKTISQEKCRYEDVSKLLQKAISELDAKASHPFIEEDLLLRFKTCVTEILESLGNGRELLKSSLQNDPTQQLLSHIFGANVGLPLCAEALEAIYSKGKKRYEQRVPPGYKDDNKPEPYRYGDLVIWEEVIEEAIRKKQPAILVLDDRKEDWWSISDKHITGPRPELLMEFRRRTGNDIYIYNTQTFSDHAKKRTSGLTPKASEELQIAADLQEVTEKTSRSDLHGLYDSAKLPYASDVMDEKNLIALESAIKPIGLSTPALSAVAELIQSDIRRRRELLGTSITAANSILRPIDLGDLKAIEAILNSYKSILGRPEDGDLGGHQG